MRLSPTTHTLHQPNSTPLRPIPPSRPIATSSQLCNTIRILARCLQASDSARRDMSILASSLNGRRHGHGPPNHPPNHQPKRQETSLSWEGVRRRREVRPHDRYGARTRTAIAGMFARRKTSLYTLFFSLLKEKKLEKAVPPKIPRHFRECLFFRLCREKKQGFYASCACCKSGGLLEILHVIAFAAPVGRHFRFSLFWSDFQGRCDLRSYSQPRTLSLAFFSLVSFPIPERYA